MFLTVSDEAAARRIKKGSVASVNHVMDFDDSESSTLTQHSLYDLNHVELDALLALGYMRRGVQPIDCGIRVPERLLSLGFVRRRDTGDFHLAQRGQWLVNALLG